MTAFQSKWDDWAPQTREKHTDNADNGPSSTSKYRIVSAVSAKKELFLNGNPGGNCIACNKPITSADKPDAIPVVGNGPDRIAGYLHGTAECYRQWFLQAKAL